MPTASDVLLGILAVAVGSLVCAAALTAMRRSGNWLFAIVALGSAAVVAGVVGQQVYPSPASVRRLGSVAAQHQPVGPWDAGVTIPILGARATPVAAGGLLATLVGCALVLLLESAPHRRPRPAGPLLPLEDDDSV